MDHLNKNMEEFFRKSLDQFDKEPSDQLWDSLEERLDEDKQKFAFFPNWLKALLPLMLLLVFGSTIIYKNKSINSLNEKLAALEVDNEKLKTEIQSINSRRMTTNSVTKNEEATNAIQTPAKEFIYLYDTVTNTKYIKEYVYQKSLRPMSFPDFKLEAPSYTTSLSGFSNSKYYNPASNILEDENKSEFSLPPLVSSLASNFNAIESNQTVTDRIPFLSTSGLAQEKKNRKKAKLPEAPLIVTPFDPWGKPQFYYRAGITGRLIYSLKGEQFSNSSLGGGRGFQQEFGLTTRFAITSGITFNNQEYALNGGGGIIAANQIQNFPEIEMFGEQLIRVEVESDFLEIPLGFKYDFYQDNRKSFFINPAINWSIHQPQEFNYFLSDSRVKKVFSDKRLGYLSSVNLLLGIERPINRYIAYQAGIAYEHNLVPIGVEKQNLRNIHLKFNLLFGKK